MPLLCGRDLALMHRVVLASIPVLCGAIGCDEEAKKVAHDHQVDPLLHCTEGYEPDPRDGTFDPIPHEIRSRERGEDGEPLLRDLSLPEPMLDWLDSHGWPQQHDDWHNVRRWDQGCRKSFASADECASARRLAERGFKRAEIQEGAPGDGYAFMVMHRHMIRGLKQAFPKSQSLLEGFTRVPREQSDPQHYMSWRTLRWTADQLVAIDKLENIEDHLDEFPTEDDLALYIEDPFRWTPENPSAFLEDQSNGIHFGLHAQWSVTGSPIELGNGQQNVYHFMFWKLHGWLDTVWERYRQAKGIREDDATYTRALREQCEEMHALDDRTRAPVVDGGNVPVETGVFAETVRPIFDRHCATCHGGGGPTLGLVLGGAGVRSSEVLDGIVGVTATETELALIEPGDPMRSWIYLKSIGSFEGIDCTACKTIMPPAGALMTDEELAALRTWIEGGAGRD